MVPTTVTDKVIAADFAIGDRVVTASSVRPVHYANRSGTIVSLNVRDNEIGLWLGNYGSDGHRSVIWFRPREIVASDTATTAPKRPCCRRASFRVVTGLAEQAVKR